MLWGGRKLRQRIGLELGAAIVAATLTPVAPASQPSAESEPASSQTIPGDPRALYQALNQLRADGTRVYAVHGIVLRRDIVSITLTEGRLALFAPLGGRVSGAVFTGVGHVFATPRDRVERQSLAQFLGLPMLDQAFSKAYFRFTDDSALEIVHQLESEGSKPESDPDFASSWESNIAALNPWHSLRILFDWLSSDPLPYFYAGIVSNAAGAFDVLVDARRAEQVLIGQPRLTEAGRFYDMWASFRSTAAPAVAADTFSPLDYRVDTTIADNLSLEGTTTLHLKAVRPGERVIPLELSRNLLVESVTTDSGAPLVHFQNEDMSRRDILRRGNDSLVVVLPAAAKANEVFRIAVKYQGSVISDAGNGVEFVGEHGAWYAHTTGGDRFVPFDLRFRWPKRFSLVATGTKTESHEEGDPKSARWQSELPYAVAGFNLGEYKVEAIAGDHPKIHVYANRQLENAILEKLRQNPALYRSAPNPPFTGTPGGGQVSELDAEPTAPRPTDVMRHLGGDIADSIRFFEQLNGPFPFDHLDVSQIPGNFGQGWPGLVYLSTLAFLPQETEIEFGERTQLAAHELLPFHEVVHQWWGNVVGSARYRDGWIEEAMANYLALLYSDTKKPGAHRLASWLEYFRGLLLAKTPRGDQTVEEAGPLTFGFRLSSSKTPNAYEAITYGKGTWVIYMLHEMLRDPASSDPDARFRQMLRSVLAEYRFRPLSTREFQSAVEKVMTPAMDLESTHSMDWFFDEWVRGTGIPRYKVEFQVKQRGQQYVVTGKLDQDGVGEAFTAPVPLYAPRSAGKRERLGVVVTTGPETRFHFVSRSKPNKILIDPNHTILCRAE